jgi:hypothetical protein
MRLSFVKVPGERFGRWHFSSFERDPLLETGEGFQSPSRRTCCAATDFRNSLLFPFW